MQPSFFTQALLVAAAPAFSQDFLAPLVVTASRFGQAAENVPYTAQSIDLTTLRENQHRSLPEALQFTPGVLVQKTAHGHGSPFIRGFTGRQNLLLVDGVRLNNSTYRSGPVQYWSTVDPLSIQRIELIKSQGSVLFGSDAVGGTLNAFTKFSDFRAKKSGEAYTAGSAAYEYRSSGQGSHVGRLETEAGVGENFGVWLGVSAKDFGDIEDSAVGRMNGTGYPEQGLDFRADFAISPDSTLTLAHQYLNQDAISRWHRTLANPGWNHDGHLAAPGRWTANDYDQERSLSYLRYAGTSPQQAAFITRWNATLSYQTTADSEFQNRNPAEDSLRQSNIDLATSGIDLTLESDLGPGTLVYGFDFYHDEINSSGSRNNRAGTAFKESLPIADDSNYDLFGVFSQYQWKPVERLEITPGIRYTLAEASLGRFYDASGTLQRNESQTWDSLVGTLRGIYHIDPQLSLFSGISQAFRAPNLDDLTGNLSAKSGATALGSTDLDSEEFITYEIGTRHQTATTSLEASIFYTDVDQLISAVPTTLGASSTVATNASQGYIYGAELQAAWRFHTQWTLTGFAAWQDGRTETPDFIGGPISDKPMTRLLPLTGSLALRWTCESAKYWIEGRLLGATKEDRITAVDQAADSQRIPTGGTPDYLVASLRAGWEIHENLSLTCGIENLSDQDHRKHGSGQNEPGLQGIFGIRASW